MRLSLALIALLALAAPQQFKSGVEMLTIDVQVVGADGEPLLGLNAADFVVTIDGRRRPVASVQFLEQTSRGRFIQARRQPGDPEPEGAAGSGRTRDGRIFVLAVDENSFWMSHARAANEAARLFIDRLAAEDYVGLATFPTSALRIAPTREHFKVREALDTIMGMKAPPPPGMTEMSLAEVFDITAGDTDTLNVVIKRVCHPQDRACPRRVSADASMLAQDLAMNAQQSLDGLRTLLTALDDVEGRKTVVLLSGGLVLSDRVGGGPNLRNETMTIGRLAAEANTTLYVLHIDMSFAEAFSPRSGVVSTALMRETGAFRAGLSMLAGAAGGQMFSVITEADTAFDRVLRETSAYYLLAVAPLESERDGRPRRVVVEVTKPGAQVRSRNVVMLGETKN